jgi:hypothetical protein
MTFRRLLHLLRAYAEQYPDAGALDREVVVRVATREHGEDGEDDLHVGGLREVSVDAGCTDEETLVLDADDEESGWLDADYDTSAIVPAGTTALVARPAAGTTALVARPDLPLAWYRTCATCWRELDPGASYARDRDLGYPICLSCAPLWLTRGRKSLVVVCYRVESKYGIRCWVVGGRCPVQTSGDTASRTHPGWTTWHPLRCVLSAGHAPGCVF